ncbi:hypothetical protein [Chryseobacterium caseinilyticum]|uniref:DUF4369 domain-containing protein n=1 Tax=Chryseobacterium caseinilyticum TaxID=2771428 RepID=A0ABR8Z7T0_9FLAO|nr:hypothetical protein [Chryseobacterium caseinilyticum]MBD8081350.1 hypothetical protein [Chryseobacterium caseinilyticum]
MKKFILFLIPLLFLSCKSYVVKNVNFISETLVVYAKISRIDSTGNDYVYFLKNDTMKAFFTKSKFCTEEMRSVIDTAQIYQLKVKTDAKFNYLSKTYGEVYFHEGIDTIFNYRDYRLILLDSPDICGKTIRCKENPEFKEKFFESIKFIDTLINSNQGKKFRETLNFISKYTHVTSESLLNYGGIYPGGVYKDDKKIWLDWYEKNKCTNIQFKK